jgi:hypothetical protein
MTKKGVMNTLQQDDMPPNMDEGCRQHLDMLSTFLTQSYFVNAKFAIVWWLIGSWQLSEVPTNLFTSSSNIAVPSSSFSLPCTLFDARFNLFSAGRTAPRGSEPDPYKQ